jgi:hypothetical protein
MSLKWCWGWEIGASGSFYEGSGWTLSDTDVEQIDTCNSALTSQPSDGFGGGNFSLRLSKAEFVTAPTIYSAADELKEFTLNFVVRVPSDAGGYSDDSFGMAVLNFGNDSLIQIQPRDDTTDPDEFDVFVRDRFNSINHFGSTTVKGYDTWHHIVLTLNSSINGLDSSSGMQVGVMVNGVLELTGTSSSGTPNIVADGGRALKTIIMGTWHKGSAADDYTFYDEIFLFEGIAHTPADPRAQKLYIQGLPLTADVDNHNFARSADGGTSNLFQNLTGSTSGGKSIAGNDTFITSSVLGGSVSQTSALFDFADFSTVNSAFNPAIKAVGVVSMVSGSGDFDQFAHIQKLGSTYSTGSFQTAATVATFITSSLRETDPDGNVWTKANCNSLKIGLIATGTV